MRPEKRRIVIFIDWYLPAFKAGGPIRSVHNIVNLIGEDAQFFIVTGNKDLGDTQPLEGIICNHWTQQEGIQVMYIDEQNRTVTSYQSIIAEIQSADYLSQ
jgi:hypothetical protein